MKNLDCDVIYDLLPSYIDGVCSNSTRTCVEAHLESCPACAERAKRLQETALSGESLERIALDAVRRIKRRAVWRTALRIVLALPFLTFSSLGFNLALRGRNVIFTGQFLPENGFGLLAVCLLVCAFFLQGRDEKPQRADRRALVLSLLAAAASVGLMLSLHALLIAPISVFPLFGLIPPDAAGPLVRWLYAALFFLQAAVFLWALLRLWKQDLHTAPVLQASMAGMMLPMSYLAMLCSMDIDIGGDLEILLRIQLQNTGITLLIGALGIVLRAFVKRYQRKNKGLPFEKNLL